MADLLSTGRAPRARLRELLSAGTPLMAPGAYDALSARLIEQAGFDVVYMTGFGTTASLIGRPDVGLLSGTEMIDNARRIVAAVDVPVIADADMVGKIRAAVAARRDPDFVLIARTDAAAVEGLDAAIARAHSYAEAGA